MTWSKGVKRRIKLFAFYEESCVFEFDNSAGSTHVYLAISIPADQMLHVSSLLNRSLPTFPSFRFFLFSTRKILSLIERFD